MEKTKKISVRTMALVGILSALVFALSSVSIQIGDISRIHFGNIMCLLSGVLFGPFVGGLSAGLGSMFYDFTNPLYISEFWITFLTKFAMGFVAGYFSRQFHNKLPAAAKYFLPALAGSFTYVVLYVVKSIIFQFYVYGNPWDAVVPTVIAKGGISAINGLIAVIAVTVFAPILHMALERAHLFPPAKQM